VILDTDLKTIFAKAFSISSSNPAVDDVTGQQENEEDVGIGLVPVGVQEAENEEDIHVDDQASVDDHDAAYHQATVDDLIASQREGDGLIEVMNSDHIEPDPGLRIPIDDFHPNIRDEVRLAYVAKGPTQPIGHDYPHDHFDRKFCETWYKKHPWLEYSVQKDAAYFYCFLFRQDPVDDKFGHTTFTKEGYNT
jgi:hypothetical protein